MNIQSDDDAVQLSDDVLETLNSADNITLLVKYKNTTNGPGSLLSVSDTSKNDAHFHLYQSGNRVGFEFRNVLIGLTQLGAKSCKSPKYRTAEVLQ